MIINCEQFFFPPPPPPFVSLLLLDYEIFRLIFNFAHELIFNPFGLEKIFISRVFTGCVRGRWISVDKYLWSIFRTLYEYVVRFHLFVGE